MSDRFSDNFGDLLRAGSASDAQQERRQLGRGDEDIPLLLRELSNSGEFLRTIKCSTGVLTVIVGDEALANFRLKLSGKGCAVVNMRLGDRDLHMSEVLLVGSSEYLRRSQTVAELLETAGCPASSHADILSRIGLEGFESNNPAELNADLKARLAIVASFFSKARVVVYDDPFKDVSTRWIRPLASLMLEGASIGHRISIATGVKRIPRSWRGKEGLQVEGAEGPIELARGTGSFEALYTTKVRELMRDNRHSVMGRSIFVTRPQMIYPKRSEQFETLQSEAITNPNSETIAGAMAVQNDEVSQKRSPSGSSKRKPSGVLTKVTMGDRLKRSFIFHAISDAFENISSAENREKDEEFLPPAARLERQKENHFRMQHTVGIGVTALLVLSAFLWVFLR